MSETEMSKKKKKDPFQDAIESPQLFLEYNPEVTNQQQQHQVMLNKQIVL